MDTPTLCAGELTTTTPGGGTTTTTEGGTTTTTEGGTTTTTTTTTTTATATAATTATTTATTTTTATATCKPLEGIPRVQSTCSTGTTPSGGECLLECLDSNLAINETFKTIDCKLLEDGSAEWHVKDVKTTLEELRLKEFCSENEDGEDIIKYCPELPSLSGVSIKCIGGEKEKVPNNKVPKDGHCLLNCINGQQFFEAYRVLHCRERDVVGDGEKLKFVNNTNHKPIERDVLTTIDFCHPPKTRYNVKVSLMEAALGNSLREAPPPKKNNKKTMVLFGKVFPNV